MANSEKHFTPIVWAFVNEAKNLGPRNAIRKKIKEALKDSLKKWTDLHVGPKRMISVKAQMLFNEYNAKVEEIEKINPADLSWRRRKLLGTTEGKSKLVFEHTTPLGEFSEALLKAGSQLSMPGHCYGLKKNKKILDS